MNSNLLFTRLSALAGREENVEKYFDHELTSYPMSLFKTSLMRKPEKASLRNAILLTETTACRSSVKVIDGGSLLHQVDWPVGVLYSDLLSHFVVSVRKRFGSCHIIFDGYDTPSVKDHEHIQRSSQVK